MYHKPFGLSVGALVWDAQGRLLLLRRSFACKHFAGLWELPGGKVDSGEQVDAAVLREVREETGFDVYLHSVAGATWFELPKLRVAMLYFHAQLIEGTFQLSSEHCEFQWIIPQHLVKFTLAEPLQKFVNAIRALIAPALQDPHDQQHQTT